MGKAYRRMMLVGDRVVHVPAPPQAVSSQEEEPPETKRSRRRPSGTMPVPV
jgi:hypothetical protein